MFSWRIRNLNKHKYYRILFLIGGIYNLFGAIIFGFLPIFVDSLLPFFGIANPDSLLFINLTFGIVAIASIGYFALYKDITKNHAIVVFGLVGRAISFIIVLIYFLIGDCNWIFLLFLSPDLIQAGLYLEFLLNFKKLSD